MFYFCIDLYFLYLRIKKKKMRIKKSSEVDIIRKTTKPSRATAKNDFFTPLSQLKRQGRGSVPGTLLRPDNAFINQANLADT